MDFNKLYEWSIYILGVFGLDRLAFRSGIVGGIISLAYDERKTSWWKSFLIILTAGVFAGYCTPMLGLKLKIEGESTKAAFGFLLGLMAQQLIPALINLARYIVKNPTILIPSNLKKLFKDVRSNRSNKSDPQ